MAYGPISLTNTAGALARLMLKPPAIDTLAFDTPGVFSLTDPKKLKPPLSHNFNADNYCGPWLM